MKKLILAASAALMFGATSVMADMFDRDYLLSTTGTGTFSRVYACRGELKAVVIERIGDTAILGGTNMTVTVASSFGTQFSYAWDGNTKTVKYPLVVADKAADGTTLTSVYSAIPLAGETTVAIATPSDISVTNTFKVTLIFDR